MNSRLNPIYALLVAGAAALSACGEKGPTEVVAGSLPLFVVGEAGPIGSSSTPQVGKFKVCNSSTSATATFAITGSTITTATVAPGQCVTVAEDMSGPGSTVSVTQTSGGLQSVSAKRIDPNGVADEPFSNGQARLVNQAHGFVVTFFSVVVVSPPAEVCDFITFGRLVTSSGGAKVVVSGNAGGNKPGGGILGEFRIEFNGIVNQVSDIATYGPITSGALSGPSYPNARAVTGTAKNGAAVELRLWDNGEPGKNTDYIWFKIGNATYGPLAIDQGNMQYHANCRGPK